MKELKVGERVTIEVQDVKPGTNLCTGCFFLSEGCCSMSFKLPCTKRLRSYNKDIIYKEVKESV